jgi:hypothetical protein
MINFIPVAFTGEEDTCPVCIARVKLEASLQSTAEALNKLGVSCFSVSLSGETAASMMQLLGNWQGLLADYRVAFSLNLAIWFSAERHGRVKKVPDLLLAYDEYRSRLLNELAAYKAAHGQLLASMSKEPAKESVQTALEAFSRLHDELTVSFDDFFAEVDKWTDKRRDDAFSVL